MPQQNAWGVERLGKYNATLESGLNLIEPFIDRVAYRHSLKEVPLDVPEQVCITKDNTQLPSMASSTPRLRYRAWRVTALRITCSPQINSKKQVESRPSAICADGVRRPTALAVNYADANTRIAEGPEKRKQYLQATVAPPALTRLRRKEEKMRAAHERAQRAGGPARLGAKNDSTSGPVCGRWTRVVARFVALYSVLACSPAHADVISEGDRVMLQLGPYVYHRIDNTDHNQWPRLIGLEYESASHWLGGAASFRNSYYQNAAYLYGGKRWFIDAVSDHLYFKLSAGLVYGYKDPYENKLPVNHNGYGLGIVPAFGLQYGRVNAQIELLGTIGLVFTFGYDILN